MNGPIPRATTRTAMVITRLASSISAQRLLALRFALIVGYAWTVTQPWFAPGSLLGERQTIQSGAQLGAWWVLVPFGLAFGFAWMRIAFGGWRIWYALLGLFDVLASFSLGGVLLYYALDATHSVQFAYRVAQLIVVAFILTSVWSAFMRRVTVVVPTPQVSDDPSQTDAGAPVLARRPKAADELVLIVHGTGSAAVADAGTKWWQVGGSFCESLYDALPDAIRPHDVGEVFHWTGANLESERRAAGRALAAHLRALAPKWKRIHLIGHSHGGSVIWHALRELRREPVFDRIGRVITLGTPYLRMQPSQGAALMVATVAIVFGFIYLAWSRWLRDAFEVGLAPWTMGAGGAVAAFMLAAVATLITTSGRATRMLLWMHRCKRERVADVETATALGDRMTAAWSRNDEAVNGLAVTTTAGGGIVISLGGPVKPQSYVFAPFRTLYDDVIGPILDQVLWFRTSRRLQGIDYRGARFDCAIPHPLGAEHSRSLPSDVSVAIDDWVAEHSSLALRRARESLGVYWATGTSIRQITSFISGQLSGKELVHWGYYQHPAMLAVMTSIISEGRPVEWGPPVEPRTAAPSPRELRVLRAKAAVGGLALAVVSMAIVWSVAESWHRVDVYPRTNRAAVAASILSIDVREVEKESAIDPLGPWFRLHTTGSENGGANDPRSLLLAMAQLDSAHRRSAMFAPVEQFPQFRRSCRDLYAAAIGTMSVQAARDSMVARIPANVPAPALARQVVEQVDDDLIRRLAPHAIDYLRSCIRFNPDMNFFLPAAARGKGGFLASFFRTRNDDGDSRVAAAIYVARAWAGDAAVLEQMLAPVSGGSDPMIRSWNAIDAATIVSTRGGSKARPYAKELLLTAMRGADHGGKAAVSSVACAFPFTIETDDSTFSEGDRQLLQWMRWRCDAVELIRLGGSLSVKDAIDSIEMSFAIALDGGAAPPADSVSLGIAHVRDGAHDDVRKSRIIGDGGVLLARAGDLRQARDAQDQCVVSTDKLRVSHAILHAYKARYPLPNFAAIVAEARNLELLAPKKE